jgi:hypothetical protein
LLDAARCLGVGLAEEVHAFAEAGGVFVRDGEDADTALGAAGFADEVGAGASCGVGQSSVHDLDEGVGHR